MHFLHKITLLDEKLLETQSFSCVGTDGTLNMAGTWTATQIVTETVSVFQEIHPYLYCSVL